MVSSENILNANATIEPLAIIAKHPLFRDLSEPLVKQLGARIVKSHVTRGTEIFSKGDAGTGLICIVTGEVKITASSSDGREAVFNIIYAGEIFGEIALLDGGPRSTGATAMTDCDLVSIDRRDFLSLLRAQPDVAIKIIEFVCGRLRRTTEQVHDIMFLNSAARLAKAMLQISEQQHDTGSWRSVKITQQELSQIIGLSREMTNKQLQIWERAKWIRIERGSIVLLKPGELQELSAGHV